MGLFLIGYGGMALAVIVFATWTTNVLNLYSTALAARASVPLGRYRSVVVASGVVGTASALVGISDNLIDFLVTMGLLVPPIAGVYLADFFVFKRTDFSAERLENRPPIRINAVVVGLGTGIVSTWMFYTDRSLTSIGALDSLLMSLVFYIALQKITGKDKQ